MTRTTEQLNGVMTVGEVARRGGVTPGAVRRWADAGKLRAMVTQTGTRFFHASDVEAFLVARKAKSARRDRDKG